MNTLTATSFDLRRFEEAFAERIRTTEPLARYTSARLGGPADAFLEVETADELAQAVSLAWETEIPFIILGGGSNVLVSDRGVRALVILNRARVIRFDEQNEPPQVWAESGTNFGVLARQAAQRGLAGLEWAAGIPGTVGGAVVGNAGAHGGDMAGNLVVAQILHQTASGPQSESWPVEKLEYAYRTSALKQAPEKQVVLAAQLKLERSPVEAVQAKLDEYVAYRKRTQPPGASLGSMFKNPPGDYAGRLIEAAGLKGARRGDVQISPLHANFFINLGNASARDLYELIRLAQATVAEKQGVALELEIELLGEW